MALLAYLFGLGVGGLQEPERVYVMSGATELETVAPKADRRRSVVHVVWYESEAEVSKILGYDAWGFAEWDGETCFIHAPRPNFVRDDPRTDTLGHELLHCLWGEYHE